MITIRPAEDGWYWVALTMPGAKPDKPIRMHQTAWRAEDLKELKDKLNALVMLEDVDAETK
jgi:hypothetical protein